MSRLVIVACLIWGVMIGGCATIPAQQMSDARQAMRAAREAGAEQLAPEEFNEAKILIDDADRFLGEGRYDLAGKVAQRAKYLALKARNKALEQKAREHKAQ